MHEIKTAFSMCDRDGSVSGSTGFSFFFFSFFCFFLVFPKRLPLGFYLAYGAENCAESGDAGGAGGFGGSETLWADGYRRKRLD
jgi:hypothetical protein